MGDHEKGNVWIALAKIGIDRIQIFNNRRRRTVIKIAQVELSANGFSMAAMIGG